MVKTTLVTNASSVTNASLDVIPKENNEDTDFSKYFNFIWKRVHSWVNTKPTLLNSFEREDMFQECFCYFLKEWRNREVKEEWQGKTKQQLFNCCASIIDQVLHDMGILYPKRKGKFFQSSLDAPLGEDIDGEYSLLDLVATEDKRLQNVAEGNFQEDSIWDRFTEFMSMQSATAQQIILCRLGEGENQEYDSFLTQKVFSKQLTVNDKKGVAGSRYCTIDALRRTQKVVCEYLQISDVTHRREVNRLKENFKIEFIEDMGVVG